MLHNDGERLDVILKMARIIGAVLGMAALTVMFSYGGSSFLSEAPIELWDQNSVVVRFHATGLDKSDASSNQSSLAKAFFEEDGFSGAGSFDGEGLSEDIIVDCKFLAPVATAISGGDYADISIVADDPASCTDLRNCCVYTIDADYTDPCTIDIQCILDPLLAYLNNTQLDLNFRLRQYMQTNMQDDSGVIVTAIVENGDPLGVPDSNIFDIDAATIHRDDNGADCDGSSDSFVINDDDPWSGQGVNGPDILNHGDFLWNVDTTGAVDVVENYSDCTMYYENMTGSVSLEPVSSGGSVVKNTLIDGTGKICNSQSYTECDGKDTATFDFLANMFLATDQTFAQIGANHVCAEGDA